MLTAVEITPSASAVNTVANILTSYKLQKTWKRYHSSHGSAPLDDLAAQFLENSDSLEARPDLALFGKKLIGIEARALGAPKPDEGDDIVEARVKLKKLEHHLASMLPKQHDEEPELSETMESILHMERKETAQVPFAPIRSTWNFFKGWALEFWHEIKEHPYLSGIMGAVVGGGTWWSTHRIPQSNNVVMTPDETTITNLHAGNMFSPGTLEYDPSLFTTDMGQSCHNHIKDITGSQWMADHLQYIFPQDCTGLNLFATRIIGGVNAFSDRLRFVTEIPVAGLANVALQSPLMMEFAAAAHASGNDVTRFDKFENLAFHGGLTITHWYMMHRASLMNTDEVKKKWNTMCDFAKRTVQNNYLNYSGAVLGGLGYIQAGLPEPYVGAFWTAAGGALGGHAIHKVMNIRNRKQHVAETIAPARESLEDFNDAYQVSEADLAIAPRKTLREKFQETRASIESIPQSVEDYFTALPERVVKGVKALPSKSHEFYEAAILSNALQSSDPIMYLMPENKTVKKVAIAVGSATAVTLGTLVALDSQQMLHNETLVAASRWTVRKAAQGMVWSLYGGINGPQDMALHIPFAIAGTAAGAVTGTIWKATKTVAKRIKTGPEPMITLGLQNPEFYA